MQTPNVTENWNEIEISWLLDFFLTADIKKKELDLCITVVNNLFLFLNWSKRHVLKQQIMCDYDDSFFTRGRLESHLGSSYDWDRLTSVTNELDGMKRTTAFSTTSLFHICGDGEIFLSNVLWRCRANVAESEKYSCVFFVKQHFQSVACFSAFTTACQGSCSKWPSFLTFTDISYLMRVKSSRLND